jgi:hypothetical protein
MSEKLLFGEQIQILENDLEEKNHLKVSYNFEGKKCEGYIEFTKKFKKK